MIRKIEEKEKKKEGKIEKRKKKLPLLPHRKYF